MADRKDLLFDDTTSKMVYGHEPWLEMVESHCHAGERAELLVKWGHNMQSEGLCKKDSLTAMAVTPAGETTILAVEAGFSDYYVLHVPIPTNGYYHVVVQNTGDYVLDKDYQYYQGARREYPEAGHATHYIQYAQYFVWVGHGLESKPRLAGLQLEIAPVKWGPWRAGDELALEILLRGNRETDAVLDVAYANGVDYRQWKKIGDIDGRIILQPQDPGRYLVVARRQVQERQDGGYDSLSLTTTLSFLVLK